MSCFTSCGLIHHHQHQLVVLCPVSLWAPLMGGVVGLQATHSQTGRRAGAEVQSWLGGERLAPASRSLVSEVYFYPSAPIPVEENMAANADRPDCNESGPGPGPGPGAGSGSAATPQRLAVIM